MMHKRETTFLLVRPHLGNEAAQQIAELGEASLDPLAQEYRREYWPRHNVLRQIGQLREQIEDISAQHHLPIKLLEVQLRHRLTRHYQSQDLDKHYPAIKQSDVITSLDPTYNEVKEYCRRLRTNVQQQLFLVFDDSETYDKVLCDFGREFSQYSFQLILKQQEKVSSDRRNRVHLAELQNEKSVERAVEQILVTRQPSAA